MEFKNVLKILNSFADLKKAEKWDNVGLLIEPTNIDKVSKILLTNDLTQNVLKEAIEKKINCIVSYHPPLFSSFKKLNQNNIKQKIAIQCIENNIAVFSHHTAIDAKCGGVNDWLANGVNNGKLKSNKPLQQSFELNSNEKYKIVTFVPENEISKVREAMANAGAGQIGAYSQCSFVIDGIGSFKGDKNSNPSIGEKEKLEFVENEKRLEMVCSKSNLSNVINALKSNHSYEEVAFEIYELFEKPIENTGMGRIIELEQSMKLNEIISNLKTHLGVKHLRVGYAANNNVDIKRVGICAGSGASLLSNARCDLWLSGEAGHHDVLSAIESNTNVILAEHSNSERGYIRSVMKSELQNMFGDSVQVLMSENDADPLSIA